MEKMNFILRQVYNMTGVTITEVTSVNEIHTLYGYSGNDNKVVPVGINRIEEIVQAYHGEEPEILTYDSAVY
ncbi:MAG: hypothetical protein K6E43_03810, partial [Lachnospiraceae bacterium]|nr:hypothetical protein [Lachnospiraceae bacterium]